MYDDTYEDEYLKGTPDLGWGVFACVLLAIIVGIFTAGCTDSPPPKSVTSRVPSEVLKRQIAVCDNNEGLREWSVTLKSSLIVKTSVICNNGMTKEF